MFADQGRRSRGYSLLASRAVGYSVSSKHVAGFFQSCLANLYRDTLDIEEPVIFANRVCNALKADPRSVDLRAQSAYFYAFATKYLEWTDREDLLQIILDTFRSRVARLADHAHNPQGAINEGIDFLRGFDETERARMCKIAPDLWTFAQMK